MQPASAVHNGGYRTSSAAQHKLQRVTEGRWLRAPDCRFRIRRGGAVDADVAAQIVPFGVGPGFGSRQRAARLPAAGGSPAPQEVRTVTVLLPVVGDVDGLGVRSVVTLSSVLPTRIVALLSGR